MKKILIIALSVGLIVPAVAQITKQQQVTKIEGKKEVRKNAKITPEKYAERKVMVLDNQVKLTQAQKTQAYKAYMENAPKRIGAIGTDSKTISEVTQLENQKIDLILTADQKATIQKNQADGAATHREITKSREVKRSSADANLDRAPLKDQLTK